MSRLGSYAKMYLGVTSSIQKQLSKRSFVRRRSSSARTAATTRTRYELLRQDNEGSVQDPLHTCVTVQAEVESASARIATTSFCAWWSITCRVASRWAMPTKENDQFANEHEPFRGCVHHEPCWLATALNRLIRTSNVCLPAVHVLTAVTAPVTELKPCLPWQPQTPHQ